LSLHPSLLVTSPLVAGQVVDGKYAIEKALGAGGMGVVYLARDVHTQVSVVVKAIRRELAHDEKYRTRTLAEGRALARIDHPNVVRLNAVVAEADALYLVMQYIEGPTLTELIERHAETGTPFPLRELLRLFRQIVSGVGAAHAEGIIHRDLKPDNVLVRASDGVVKVTDFGIAKDAEDARAGRGITEGFIGTAAYMAPEQFSGERPMDRRVDIYALGVVLFELLAGRPPFGGASTFDVLMQHLKAPLPNLRTLRPDVPESIARVVERACAKVPEERFESARAFLRALDSVEEPEEPEPLAAVARTAPGGPPNFSAHPASAASRTSAGAAVMVPVIPPGPRRSAPRRSGVPLLVGGAAALVGLAALGVVLARKPRDEAPPPLVTGDVSALSGSAREAGSAVAPSAEAADFASLGGAWTSDTGRRYSAVTVGQGLEFRVVDPEQFAGQGYAVNEARFTLSARSATGYFVRDHVRPVPPRGTRYAPSARATCLNTWTEAAGVPLEARLVDGRLEVTMARIHPSLSMFEVRGAEVTACRELAAARADTVVSRLSR
jgi:serine/threonine-protein kinase